MGPPLVRVRNGHSSWHKIMNFHFSKACARDIFSQFSKNSARGASFSMLGVFSILTEFITFLTSMQFLKFKRKSTFRSVSGITHVQVSSGDLT